MPLEPLKMFLVVISITLNPDGQTVQGKKPLPVSTTDMECLEEAMKYHGMMVEKYPGAYRILTTCETYTPAK